MSENEPNKQVQDGLRRMAQTLIETQNMKDGVKQKDYRQDLKKKYYYRDVLFYVLEIAICLSLFLFITLLNQDFLGVKTTITNYFSRRCLSWSFVMLQTLWNILVPFIQIVVPIYIVEILRIWDKKKNMYKFYSGKINVLINGLNQYYYYGNGYKINNICVKEIINSDNDTNKLFYDYSEKLTSFSIGYDFGIQEFDAIIRNLYILTTLKLMLKESTGIVDMQKCNTIINTARLHIKYMRIDVMKKYFDEIDYEIIELLEKRKNNE